MGWRPEDRVGPELHYALDLTGLSVRTFTLGDERLRLNQAYKLNNLTPGLVFGKANGRGGLFLAPHQ